MEYHEKDNTGYVDNKRNYKKFKSGLSNMDNYEIINDKQNYYEREQEVNKEERNSDSGQGLD